MSAFRVFIDHWLVEENKIRRRLYFERTRNKIKKSVISRLFVFRFFALLKEWPGDIDEVPSQIRNYGLCLGRRNAVAGVCKGCKTSVKRFSLEEDVLWCRCQGCRRVSVVLTLSDYD